MADRAWDLEDRLLDYAAMIIRLAEGFPKTPAGQHVGDHLLRSGTSALFHHGEAEAAESPKDFVHKLKVCLKELREAHRTLRLAVRVGLVQPGSEVDPTLRETDELIRIFVASIRTANERKEKPDD
jgi:four helix bundle protein